MGIGMRQWLMMLTVMGVAAFEMHGRSAVVADSLTHAPLAYASLFDNAGRFQGAADAKGRLPYIAEEAYPITVRYMGYFEKEINASGPDTIFLVENMPELPEVVIEAKQHRLLHILAYVREYSSLATYTDSIFMFREKMVDFMLPTHAKIKFAGWRTPRVITSRSYYRFTNSNGLDSVSNTCNQHFSWSDWVGITPESPIPPRIARAEAINDTVHGRYGTSEIWSRHNDRITINVDVLADTAERRRVPNISNFFSKNIDFERFQIRYNFTDVVSNGVVAPIDLTGYSFNIESRGRGRNMFMFNRSDEPFFVTTYAELYIIDKEFITVKEAKGWNNMAEILKTNATIFEAAEAPPLQPSIQQLIARVDDVDYDKVRLSLAVDERLRGREVKKLNFGQQVLKRLRGMVGLDNVVAKRKINKHWKEFRQSRQSHNADMLRDSVN